MENEKVLQIVSSDTLNNVQDMLIVTPTIYTSIFNENAKSHNIEIDNELDISNEIISSECANLIHTQEQNEKNTMLLSDSTTKAIGAIRNKDENLLQEVLQETEELRKEVEKLKVNMYQDELTHLYNRKWLRDHYMCDEDTSFTKSGCMVMVDLNYFKAVNDTLGHAVGDKVLIFIANNLKKTKQHVVRYGGDEFLVLFNEKFTEENALKTLHKIREDVISKKLRAKDQEFTSSFSIGISSFKNGDKFQDVLETADKNMYQDKKEIKKRIKSI